jgi:hypothetical protein
VGYPPVLDAAIPLRAEAELPAQHRKECFGQNVNSKIQASHPAVQLQTAPSPFLNQSEYLASRGKQRLLLLAYLAMQRQRLEALMAGLAATPQHLTPMAVEDCWPAHRRQRLCCQKVGQVLNQLTLRVAKHDLAEMVSSNPMAVTKLSALQCLATHHSSWLA